MELVSRTDISKNNQTLGFGSRKIPRYLYHFTSEKNYQSMIKDGFIKVSDIDQEPLNGVFMVGLNNLINSWSNFRFNGGKSLAALLLSRASASADKLVLLKIPTKNIDINNLKIRRQKDYVYTRPSHEFQEAVYDYKTNGVMKTKYEALIEGEHPNKSKKYNQRKDAIEYICKNDIPISTVEKVGDLDVEQSKNLSLVKKFAELFKNKPEANSLKSWYK